MGEKRKKRMIFDATVIVASILLAMILAKGPYVDNLIVSTKTYYVFTSFIAGLFFTSIFTTAPAITVLAKLSLLHSPFIIALIGGIGALIGDLIIFSFIKGHIREDVEYFLKRSKSTRIKHIFKHRFFRWSLAFLGAIIIASPLPDELGLALMGLSNVRTNRFILISLSFNIIGILFIGFVAHSI